MGALMGVPVARISTEVAASINAAWNSNFRRVWELYEWLDVCPNGEARFVGNKIGYSNDLSKTAEWTATALTITGDQLANPCDGRVTASKLLETSANSTHSVAHSALAIIPSTTYVYSCYVRPNGRNWVYIKFDDGDLVHSCFFNVTTGALGTELNCTGNMQQVAGGFYLCAIQFTTSTSITATTSAVTIQISTDGSTLSYAGTTTVGLYVWGALVQQTTNTALADSLVAFDQTGEDRMEAVFEVYFDSPYASTLPRVAGYQLTPSGIQIISNTVLSYAVVNSAGVTINYQQSNPVFIFYRKQVPEFTGSVFSTTATYAVDDQVYFTNSASVLDYYKCIVATSAGQSPDTTPTSWSKLQIPDSLFWCSMWFCYGDWLISDGQADKATGAYQLAQGKMDDAMDRESRQMRNDIPMRVATHTSQQSRNGGY
jgi:hypothetical protein